MKMNTSAWDDVEAMGGGMPHTRKKMQHEERKDKDLKGSS